MDAKKTRGEVFTPEFIVNKMLDLLPCDVWTNKNLKWLEPSAGRGAFFKEVLKKLIENGIDKEYVIKHMLYMVEIDEDNVKHLREYFGKNANIISGSYIKSKNYNEIDINISFDIILGNPPFQYKKAQQKTQSIWRFFVERSYKLLKNDGYLLMIHPSGWRDINGRDRSVFNFMKANNLIYLNMNDYKQGQKVFNGAGTNFDYYLVQNTKMNDNKTIVNDIDNDEYEIDLNNWEFIPNGKLNIFEKLIAKNEKTVNVLYSRSLYEIRKSYMLNTSIYPCVYTITKSNGLKVKYSEINKGHFGIPKVIWSNGAGTYPIIDKEGHYGLTQFAYAIVDNTENFQKICDALNNEKFIKLMKYLIFKMNNKYNYKIIALFKKDFYNDFL
jgi:phospholipid N-methyltransferase